MAARVSIDSVDTNAVRESLKAGDVIYVTDSNNAKFREQLFGQHSVARVIHPYGSPPYQIQQVEIEADSSSATQLELAKAAVLAAKGHATDGP